MPGDLIMLVVDGDPLRDNTPVFTRLELLDSTGATLVNVTGSAPNGNLDNGNPPGLFETVPRFPSEGLLFRAPAGGTYYARVSVGTTGTTGAGDYLLSITKELHYWRRGAGSVDLPQRYVRGGDSPDIEYPGGRRYYRRTLLTTINSVAAPASRAPVIPQQAVPAVMSSIPLPRRLRAQYSFRAWQYQATSAGASNAVVYLADTCPAAGAGTPVTVSCLAAANFQSSTGGEELNCVSLTAGQQVYFYIDEATFGGGGTFYALVEQCGPKETEPNNTPATATPVSCGIEGQVNPGAEADFYSLGTPAAGSRLFAMVDASTTGPKADVDLRVNSATDTIEYDDLDGDSGVRSQRLRADHCGHHSDRGPAFLSGRWVRHCPSGNSFPYRLYSVVQPSSANATTESEPNDTTATASSAG